MKRLSTLLLSLALLFSLIVPGIVNAQTGFSCTNVTQIPQIECEALVALYNNTNGAGWKNNTNWLVSNTPSDWYGLTVEDGHVTKISFWGNQLSGTIPPQLGNLSQLNLLYLMFGELTGQIPAELGNLSNLRELALDYNQLSGEIPIALTQLSNLGNLFLSHNNLTGNIPPELGSMWRIFQLNLGDNQLSGNIPAELGNLINVRVMVLRNNQLTSSIPPDLGKLRLWGLYLEGNQLEGSIPPELGNLNELSTLALTNNLLTGSIPEILGNMTTLKVLKLDQNQFTGDIPSSFVNLSNLMDPGSQYDGGDGLNLDYNHLNIPFGYPDPANTLHTFLNQKDPDWHLRQAFDQVIGIDGGILSSLDGRVIVDIPVAALSDNVTFTFTPQPAPNHGTDDLLFGKNSFQLTAVDPSANPITEFAQPVNITIHYSDDDLQLSEEETLGLYYWDGSSAAWVDAVTTCAGGVYIRDMVANTLSLQICHLTEFAVLLEDTRTLIYLPSLLR